MTVKHTSPEWRKTVRIVRAQTRAAWARGDEVTCWRHGHVLDPEQPYDVGHIDPNGGEGVDNAAPECRKGNRSHGGRMGAAKTNAKRSAKTTFVALPWA